MAVVRVQSYGLAKEQMDLAVNLWLRDSADTLEDGVKRRSAVGTGETGPPGRTRDSYESDLSLVGPIKTARVGSNYKNAVWEEFGTGKYAEAGNGRKDGWVYRAGGRFYYTEGKPAKRPMRKTWAANIGKIITDLKVKVGGVL